ncbi:hypothetical protein, partial [Actinomadura formosensis]|uniref:hypothetical protein n=1 Tax=Actinomadura formosensis TaxID=60706 RepID=UPI0012FBFEF7
MALITVLASASAVPAHAAVPAHTAVAQSAVVTQDCTAGRIQETVVNRSSAATTFTLTWPGVGTWTADVAAGDSAGYRCAGQCSGLQAGGEGPRGRAAGPERVLTGPAQRMK